MRDLNIPELTFPMVEYGLMETRWDLRILLYKGGAEASSRTVFNQIAAGDLGSPIIDRIELVTRIHEAMNARLVGGSTKPSASSTLRAVRTMFAWADAESLSLSVDAVEASYRLWCDFLHYRVRLGKLKLVVAYTQANQVSSILDAALERSQPLILTTRLRNVKRGERAVGFAADTQNLADLFAFGRLCLNVIDSLSLDAVFGPLPVLIRLDEGKWHENWSKLRDPARVESLQPEYKDKKTKKKVMQQRASWEADRTLATRYPLVNLRLVAELLVFIAQTGMNLSQAHQLRRTQFSYKSTIDGYQVRDYKHRRQGEVLFEIFAAYKAHFDRYLVWRDTVFANESTDRLFPFVRRFGAATSTPPDFGRFKYEICERAGVPFIGPQKLRSARVNWLLRYSKDPDLTAEHAQHTKKTLLHIYAKPSLQVAKVELVQFFKKNDPSLSGDPMLCPGSGVCDGIPSPMPGMPSEAPTPDCTYPVGCLFCEHHRDIDSADYVWSVATLRHLNTVILQRFPPIANGKADSARPVELAIEVLTVKLQWFEESNKKRKAWVEEAMEKVAESDFHTHWRYLVESAEGV